MWVTAARGRRRHTPTRARRRAVQCSMHRRRPPVSCWMLQVAEKDWKSCVISAAVGGTPSPCTRAARHRGGSATTCRADALSERPAMRAVGCPVAMSQSCEDMVARPSASSPRPQLQVTEGRRYIVTTVGAAGRCRTGPAAEAVRRDTGTRAWSGSGTIRRPFHNRRWLRNGVPVIRCGVARSQVDHVSWRDAGNAASPAYVVGVG